MMTDPRPEGAQGILGRDRELSRLESAVRAGRSAVVRGDPGSGRSTLLRAVGGGNALRARGAPAERDHPFAGVEQLRGRDEILGRLALPPDVEGIAARLAEPLHGRIVIVDDAEWWDAPSRQILLALASTGTTVLVGGDRTGDVRPWADAGAEIIDLDPLEAEVARRLVAERAPASSAREQARIVERAGGNPRALVELATVGGTPGLERSYRTRLAALDATSRTLLLRLALALSSGHSEAVEATELGAAARDFAPAQAHGVAVVGSTGVRFRHDAARRAVLLMATSAEVRDAEALLAQTRSDPTDRLWHASGAVIGPDDAIAQALERAAATAVAPERAADLLERAADLTSVDHGGLLVRTAEYRLDARDGLAVPALVERARRTELDRSSAARLALVDAVVGLGDRHPAELFRGLLDVLPDFDALDGKLRRAEQIALELALWSGRPDWVDQLAGPLRSGNPLGEVSAALARALRGADPRLGVLPRGDEDDLVLAAAWSVFAADAAAAREVVEELRERGATAPLGAVSVHALASLAHWHGAEVPLGVLRDDTVWGVALGLSGAAHAAALAGDGEGCRAAATEAKRLSLGMELRFASANAQWALGRLSLQEGDAERALALLSRIVETGSESAHPAVALLAAPDLVEAAQRRGDAARYSAWRERLHAASIGSAWAAAVHPRVSGLLAEDPGPDFEAAAARSAAAGETFEAARAHLLAGEHLRRERLRIRAREHLVAARDGFLAAGAVQWSARATRELDATSASVRKGPDSSGLTPREQQIAQLVATGASNQQIAVRLGMSRKTVEYHLHKTYSKLGIGSRGELASAIGDPGEPG